MRDCVVTVFKLQAFLMFKQVKTILGLNICDTYAGEEQGTKGGIDDVQDLVTDKDAEDGKE